MSLFNLDNGKKIMIPSNLFNTDTKGTEPITVRFTEVSVLYLTLYFILALSTAVTNLPNKTLIFHDFQGPKIEFHDFPGLENEILKSHDFPGFPWPARTLHEQLADKAKRRDNLLINLP